MSNNIIQKGTAISCGDNIGIALSEPVTILSLKHLSQAPVSGMDEDWSRIYLDTFYLWAGGLIVTQRSFPKTWWGATLFTAIFGNKKSLLLTKESKIL